jgi:hypothetical protein
MFISNGKCLLLPAFSDASLASWDATPDTDADDSSPEDAQNMQDGQAAPLPSCSMARDVFVIRIDSDDGAPASTEVFTNFGTNWASSERPLGFQIQYIYGAPTGFTILAATDANGATLAVPTPGTYAVGAGAAAPSITLQISVGEEPLTIDSGSVTIVDAEVDGTDAAPGVLKSLVLSFDLSAAGETVSGCLRYTQDVAPSVASAGGDDASAGSGDASVDAAVDASGSPGSSIADDLAPCAQGGYVFYTDAEGAYPGLLGPETVTGATGSWAAEIASGGYLQLRVFVGDSEWALAASVSPGVFQVGTYTSGEGQTFLQVATPTATMPQGTGFTNTPVGSFGITELVANVNEDEAPVTQLRMWFDVTTPEMGSIRGCVSYGN